MLFRTFQFKSLQWETTCRHHIFDLSATWFPFLSGSWFNAAQSSFVLCIAAASCNVHFCAALLQKDSWSLNAAWDCQRLFRDSQWFQTLFNNVRLWSSLFTAVQWCLDATNRVVQRPFWCSWGAAVFCTSVCGTKHAIVPQCFSTFIEARWCSSVLLYSGQCCWELLNGAHWRERFFLEYAVRGSFVHQYSCGHRYCVVLCDNGPWWSMPLGARCCLFSNLWCSTLLYAYHFFVMSHCSWLPLHVDRVYSLLSQAFFCCSVLLGAACPSMLLRVVRIWSVK